MTRRAGSTVLGAIAIALGVSAPAQAGTASVVSFGNSDRVDFVAAPGEANDLRLARSGDDVVLTDTSAPIAAGRGCVAQSPETVVCDPRPGYGGYLSVLALLGDGDDLAAVVSSFADVVVEGQDGADVLTGGSGSDRLEGSRGNDRLDGGGGDDILSGGDAALHEDGDDVLLGGLGDDGLLGGPGDDYLQGGRGNDYLNGGYFCCAMPAEEEWSGDDVVLGEAGHDELLGQAGEDRLVGGTGNDRLDGGGGRDTLEGGDDHDELFTAAGTRISYTLPVPVSAPEPDVATCGRGGDRIVWDLGDVFSPDCEQIEPAFGP